MRSIHINQGAAKLLVYAPFGMDMNYVFEHKIMRRFGNQIKIYF